MNKRDYRICCNCIMDTCDSGIVIDDGGWCDYCNNFHTNILPNWHTDERGEELSHRYSWSRCAHETFSFIAQTAEQVKKSSPK